MSTSSPKHTNQLIQESSPYLLQHAHNPVHWQAWNEQAWAQAKQENKLVLISIGYSACHWCHVMEHESFEDEGIAAIMNEHFVCIKVDREERPDVDQVYMTAVQLMSGHGGWPLNCFALPDGRPVYGGTYFQKAQWANVLLNLTDLWKNEADKAYHYAEQLTEGIKQAELVAVKETTAMPDQETLLKSWENWSKRVDGVEGGPNKAPKFPLPNNYLFLLHLGQSDMLALEEKEALNQHIHLTLQKMAFGGIYDQLGGGFARYSTDHLWKVPHFEKMLYDNAQLVSLYAEAYRINKNNLYKEVVYETLAFVKRELCSGEGVFYSALDADSEGEEGKYYVWTKEELKRICGSDFPLVEAYYNINETGFWEHDNYILLREKELDEICVELGLAAPDFKNKIEAVKKKLLEERAKRMRPGLDDKSLTSWNALMIKGFADAYDVFGEQDFLHDAVQCAELIASKLRTKDGGLFHSYKAGKASINGFLEDYCFTIEAFLALYENTFTEKWLLLAGELCEYVCLHFKDAHSGFFYFTSDTDAPLIARKLELSDNVIPASASSMAKCLFRLGHLLGNKAYLEMARHMLMQMQTEIRQYGAGYSNWAQLQLWMSSPFYELAIVGKGVDEMRNAFRKHSLPNVIFAGSSTTSGLGILKDRYKADATVIYVCKDQTCLEPLTDVSRVLQLITTHEV
jgi:uncharacterized protein YyaL (SSP411 family)